MLFLAFIVLITALAIASVAAYFSIIGLTLLFIGSGQSIVIMGTALEVGKLIVVSFLHQYWKELNFMVKSYLVVATILLMAITSIGIYGYLSSGYNATNNKVKELERQIHYNEKQIAQLKADSESQLIVPVDNSINNISSTRDKFNEQQLQLIKQKETRIVESRAAAEQERKKITEELSNAKSVLDSEINKEIEQIKLYDNRIKLLDDEVQTWLKQGTGGIFKVNGIEKARETKLLQEKERAQIDEQIKTKQANIEKLRLDYNNRVAELNKTSEKITDTLNSTIKAIESDITKDKQAIDEYQKKIDTTVQEQIALKETKAKNAKQKIKENDTEIEKLSAANSVIQSKVLETDVGTFKFVADSLGVKLDQAVNWFIWLIMLVFDPLAVSLVICFNFIIKLCRSKIKPVKPVEVITTPTPTSTPEPTPTITPTITESQPAAETEEQKVLRMLIEERKEQERIKAERRARGKI